MTTLGRGGSDLTATLLARALGAARVVLWKDVAGHPHRRSAAGARRAAHPAAAPPRGGRGRALRREGAASARAHPDRRHAHRARTCARSSIPSSRAPRCRRAARSPRYPVKALAIVRGQAIVTVAGKGMVGVPRHRGAHVRRGRRRAAVGVDDLPGLVGELDRLHGARRRGRPRGRRRCGRRSATSSQPGSSTASPRAPGMAVDRGRRRRHGRHAGHRGARVLRARRRAASTSSPSRRDRRSATSRSSSTSDQAARGRAPRPRRVSARRRSAAAARRRRRAPTSCCSASAGSAARSPIRWRGARATGGCASWRLLDRSGYVFEPRGCRGARLLRLAEGKDGGELLAGARRPAGLGRRGARR